MNSTSKLLPLRTLVATRSCSRMAFEIGSRGRPGIPDACRATVTHEMKPHDSSDEQTCLLEVVGDHCRAGAREVLTRACA